MKKYLFLIILLVTFNLKAQEKVTSKEVYKENNLTYKVADNQLFTGSIQNFKQKNHLISEFEFIDGVLIKGKVYYNGKEKIMAEERYFYKSNSKVEKKIKYSLDHKIIWIEYFSEDGAKKLEEDYKNGIVIYRCPFLNNKKHGIQFSINKKGEVQECLFENGKIIKNNSRKQSE